MFRSFKTLAAAIAFAGCSTSALADVVISQVYGGGGNSGATYTNDFIELFNAGTTPQNLNGWSVQYASTSGTTWATTPLSNVTLQPGQYYLIQQAAGNSGTTPLPTADAIGTIAMGAANGKVVLAKVTAAQTGACPSGSNVSDLVGFGTANCPNPTGALSSSTAAIRKDNGCAMTGSPTSDFNVAAPTPRNTASAFLPCSGPGVPGISAADITVSEGDSGVTPFVFTVSLSEATPAGGITFNFATEDGSAIAGTDYVAATGTGSIAATETTTTISIDVIANTTTQPNRTFKLNLSAIAGAFPATLSATATIRDDDIATLKIHEIQGAGFDSPVVGQRVNSVGNIVTATGPAGFFMQTKDADKDSDPMTSEGIYVFTSTAPSVQIGDEVSLTGNVLEYFGLTELGGVSGLSVTSSGNALPAAVVFDESTPSQNPATLSCGASNFECFEGMRVKIENGIVARANPYFSSDNYAQIFASAGSTRSIRTPGTLYPLVPGLDNPEAGAFLGNPHIFELDADALGAVAANTAITGGSRFSAEGVIHYSFGDYEVWPTTFAVTEANVLPRPVKAAQLGAELRIGAFNMLRLCDTLNNTTSNCGNGGEPDATELALKLSRLSDYVGNVLNLPDVLGVSEVENLDVLQQLAAKIATDHSVTYTAYLDEGNDVGGIDVGYLVRGDRVSNVTTTQFDKTETWVDPRDGQTRNLHDRPALKLEAEFAGQSFATLVIHPKSRSCVDAPTTSASCDMDEVNRNRAKRFNQAKSMALRIQQEQIAHPNRPLLVIGDFNDYQFSDGFVHITGLLEGLYDDEANTVKLGTPNIVNPPMWNAVSSLPANEQYSFLFTEQFGEIFGYTRATATSSDRGRDVPIMQVLDQALLNDAAKAWFTGFEYGRANLDAADQDMRTSTTAIGVSDHDGFVVRLATDRIFADSFGGDQ